MQLSIRDAHLDDIRTIMLIARHPLVTPNQYRLGLAAEAGFHQMLSPDWPRYSLDWRLTSIILNDRMIGYIHHNHDFSRGLKRARLGWNLHPQFWGRGIMPAAVTQLIQRCIREDETSHFVAECFSDNARCKRVIAKIGFKEVPISLFDRVVDALAHGNLKWVHRFELNANSSGVGWLGSTNGSPQSPAS
jgi:RimJ/RimL family protein N-acetyltransferase